MGALVVNLTCDVRRVAKLPSEPRGRPIKSDGLNMWTVSHSNTRTSHSNTRTQGTLGQGVAALQIHLCKGIVKSYRTPALHGLAPFPRTSNPKRHKNNRFPKCPNPCFFSFLCCSNLVRPREGFTSETSSAPHQEWAVVPPDPSRAYIRSGFR